MCVIHNYKSIEVTKIGVSVVFIFLITGGVFLKLVLPEPDHVIVSVAGYYVENSSELRLF
jgi:prefoldin subunit 5